MALIVAFENTTFGAPVSNYRVTVYIDDQIIAGPFTVKDHKRQKVGKC